ncbi:MAG: GH3 auxin-responsive promoter family protein [Phycisphaerales bacterium]
MNAWLANRVWQGANHREATAFAAALQQPREAQEAKLRAYLRTNAATAFAREHGLTESTTMDEFRHRVPARSYAEFVRYIDRIATGEKAVLTAAAVEMLTPTSGSTGAEKLIPRTPALRSEFASALAPWINDLFEQDPSLRDGPAYWSISPVGAQTARHRGVVPIGFGDDDEYLSPLGRWVASGVKAVPSDVARIRSMENWRYATLLSLLRCRSLRMVSVWHPSFFGLLLDALPEWWDRLLRDLRNGQVSPPAGGDVPRRLIAHPDISRAAELSHISPADAPGIWPALRMVSCWADGPAAPHARALEHRLGGITVQGKGLLATEAFVTIPYRGLHPVALRSHLVELEDEHGKMHSLSQAREGETYVPVITTGGGLWRYRLPDRVVVDGFVGRTPSLRFIGRADATSDLRGEKLSDAFVGGILATCAQHASLQPRFSALATIDTHLCPQMPTAAGYLWIVDVEGLIDTCAAAIEAGLCANPHYRYARQLGQLNPVRAMRVNADLVRRALEQVRPPAHAAGAVKPMWIYTGRAAQVLARASEGTNHAPHSTK